MCGFDSCYPCIKKQAVFKKKHFKKKHFKKNLSIKKIILKNKPSIKKIIFKKIKNIQSKKLKKKISHPPIKYFNFWKQLKSSKQFRVFKKGFKKLTLYRYSKYQNLLTNNSNKKVNSLTGFINFKYIYKNINTYKIFSNFFKKYFFTLVNKKIKHSVFSSQSPKTNCISFSTSSKTTMSLPIDYTFFNKNYFFDSAKNCLSTNITYNINPIYLKTPIEWGVLYKKKNYLPQYYLNAITSKSFLAPFLPHSISKEFNIFWHWLPVLSTNITHVSKTKSLLFSALIFPFFIFKQTNNFENIFDKTKWVSSARLLLNMELLVEKFKKKFKIAKILISQKFFPKRFKKKLFKKKKKILFIRRLKKKLFKKAFNYKFFNQFNLKKKNIKKFLKKRQKVGLRNIYPKTTNINLKFNTNFKFQPVKLYYNKHSYYNDYTSKFFLNHSSTNFWMYSLPINIMINLVFMPIFFKKTILKYNQSSLLTLLKLNFYTFSLKTDNRYFERDMSNLIPHIAFQFKFFKKMLNLTGSTSFKLPLTEWYKLNFLNFIEYLTGRRVLFQFYPFMAQEVAIEDVLRYKFWLPRMAYYERKLGHRFFLEEAIHILHLGFYLRDSDIIASWLRSMIMRISFWKTRSIFRFLKYLLNNYFVFAFKSLGMKGLKIKLKGKISAAGNSRKRTILYRVGSTSHSTVDARVLHEFKTINTFTGVMGFQVWLFY